MALTEGDRRAYGWLGKPPPEVMAAPAHVVKKWKQLNKRAKAVAAMRFSEKKVEAAKAVERDRNSIIEEARGHAYEHRED